MSVLELRRKRAALVNEAREILDIADKETRALSQEEENKYNNIMTDVDGLKGQIDREERQAELEAELRQSAGTTAGGQQQQPEKRNGVDSEEYRDAFNKFMKLGIEGIKPEERNLIMEHRAQAVGSGSAGGYTVPQGFYNTLMEAQKFFGGMRQARTTVLKTEKGNDLPIATTDDTGNVGAIVAENTQVTGQDVTFGQKILKAYKYTSKIVLVPIELLQDGNFDLNTFLARKLGERIGRAVNAHFTTGTGTGQPQGIVAGALSGKVGTTGQTTSVIYDDLVDLYHSIDPAYRQSCEFMFHDTTLKALKKLKDSQGRPLWLPGLAVKEPDTIIGCGYVVNNDMATMAANAKSILCGDMSNYFIRDVMDVQLIRLVERYADYGQVGFLAFSRHDGGLVDAGQGPIKYYANSAT